MESFFYSMKAELIHQRTYENEIEAVAHIVDTSNFTIAKDCTHLWATNYQRGMKNFVVCGVH